MKILEEKLDKEKLLNIMSQDPFDSFKVSKRLSKMGKKVPDELLKSISKNPWTSQEYASHLVWYKGISPEKLPEIILNGIAQDYGKTYDFLWVLITHGKNDEKIPDILLNTIAKEPTKSKYIAQVFRKNKKKVPDVIQKTIDSLDTKDINMNESTIISEKLDKERLFNTFKRNIATIYKIIKTLVKNNKKIPEYVMKIIEKNLVASVDYANLLMKHEKEVPENILKTISKQATHSLLLAKKYMTKGKKIPDVLLKGISTDSYTSYDFGVALLVTNKEIAPEIILNSIAQFPNFSRWYTQIFLQHEVKVPEIIKRGLSQSDFLDLEKIEKKTITEALDKDRLLNAAKSDSYRLSMLSIKNKKDIPETVLKNLLKYGQPYQFEDVATYFIKHGKEPPDVLVQGISRHHLESYSYAKFLNRYDKDVPDSIISTIAINSETSFYYARFLIQDDKTVPEIILNAIAKSYSSSVFYAEYLMDNNKNIPEIILKRIKNDNPNWYKKEKKLRGLEEKQNDKAITEALDKDRLLNILSQDIFDSLKASGIILYNGKNIPEVLIDTVSKNHSASKSLANSFIKKNVQIPEKILNKLNYKGNDFFSDLVTKIIFLIHDNKEIPKFFDYYISKDPKASEFYYSILKINNKEIPEVIKNAIKDKEKTITEALDKDRLMYMAVKETHVAIDLLTQLAYSGKDIPDLLSLVVAERSSASICARIASYIIAYSDKEVPEALLEKIATNKKIAKDIAYIYANNRKRIPEMIKKLLSKKDREFYDGFKGGEFFAIHTMPINEALNKDKLIDAISKDEEAYDKILRHYFYDKNELPPEKIIDMTSKDVAASVMFAEYCLEKKKEIRPDIIEKIAEHPRSAYTIAALMGIEDRNVPEILINSIKKDPLSLKHYEEFLSKRNVPIDTKVYLKI
jgi:hypothetical protein